VATTPTRLMTLAEFERLPETPRGFPYELRHGELVTVAPPKRNHLIAQHRIRDLLSVPAAGRGRAFMELGFRVPDHDYRVADVAYVTEQRWTMAGDSLFGAPELVVEVLSESNTVAEMLDKEKLCLENGSHEFWVVDLDRKQVKVSTPNGHTLTYKAGQEIPLFFAPGDAIAVSAILE
jgi:Uma2 family endonuclease